MFSFENLPPYRKSIVFVMLVFQCLSQVRGEFELKAQLKRAAMSIGCNLVEGYGRISLKEQRHFLKTSDTNENKKGQPLAVPYLCFCV